MADALILKDTPAVLSVGKRCFGQGWTFIWLPFQTPYFLTPTGDKVDMIVDNFVPYVIDKAIKQTIATPAIKGAGPGPETDRVNLVAAEKITTGTEDIKLFPKHHPDNKKEGLGKDMFEEF